MDTNEAGRARTLIVYSDGISWGVYFAVNSDGIRRLGHFTVESDGKGLAGSFTVNLEGIFRFGHIYMDSDRVGEADSFTVNSHEITCLMQFTVSRTGSAVLVLIDGLVRHQPN